MILVRITSALALYTHIHSELACSADNMTPREIYCFLRTLSLT